MLPTARKPAARPRVPVPPEEAERARAVKAELEPAAEYVPEQEAELTQGDYLMKSKAARLASARRAGPVLAPPPSTAAEPSSLDASFDVVEPAPDAVHESSPAPSADAVLPTLELSSRVLAAEAVPGDSPAVGRRAGRMPDRPTSRRLVADPAGGWPALIRPGPPAGQSPWRRVPVARPRSPDK